LRYLKMRPRRPYQTRHTAATLWLAAGERPEWIARQLGHTTTQMLFKVYSRYVPNLTRNDGSAFKAILAQQTGIITPPNKGPHGH
jgi:integrase